MNPQLKCMYETHINEDILALCVNKDCNQSRLCCFTCIQGNSHDQHSQDILKFPVFQKWSEEGAQIIKQIQQIISQQDTLNQLLKEFIKENQVTINLEFATSTEIQKSINQVNKLQIFDQILKNDFQSFSQLTNTIKNKIKGLKSGIGLQFIFILGQGTTAQQVIKQQPQLENIQKQTKPTVPEKIQFRFSEQDKNESVKLAEYGRVCYMPPPDMGSIPRYFIEVCLFEQVLPQNVETTFAIKYVTGLVGVGVCKRDIMKEVYYCPNLQILGHGYKYSYIIVFILLMQVAGFIPITKKK